MEIPMDKAALRQALKTERAALGAQERARADALIARKVLELPDFRAARTVFAYLSFGDEVDTRAIVQRALEQGKTVALPRCIPRTRSMAWHAVESIEGLVRSSYGIDEPADDPATIVDPATCAGAIALVPGLAFDEQGYRIGYGGGFYDVFLSEFPGTSAGLCRRRFLVSGSLPRDSHDLPVDLVVTD